MKGLESGRVEANGLSLHYVSAGEARDDDWPVLLLHGWPTSSFLWRNIMPHIAQHRQVIALDLPGFGASDKPLDHDYGFEFYKKSLDGFLDAMGISKLGLVVHDLGGPVGLYWASQNPEKVARLGVLNTLVYPELSWAVKAFMGSIKVPGLRSALTSQWGLRQALRVGVSNSNRLAQEALENIGEPFVTWEARQALLKTLNVNPKGFETIAAWLPTIKVPARAIYGARDRILPDIAKTVRRLQDDIPHLEVTRLEDCGHFLQEERPEEIGHALAKFFA